MLLPRGQNIEKCQNLKIPYTTLQNQKCICPPKNRFKIVKPSAKKITFIIFLRFPISSFLGRFRHQIKIYGVSLNVSVIFRSWDGEIWDSWDLYIEKSEIFKHKVTVDGTSLHQIWISIAHSIGLAELIT